MGNAGSADSAFLLSAAAAGGEAPGAATLRERGLQARRCASRGGCRANGLPPPLAHVHALSAACGKSASGQLDSARRYISFVMAQGGTIMGMKSGFVFQYTSTSTSSAGSVMPLAHQSMNRFVQLYT